MRDKEQDKRTLDVMKAVKRKLDSSVKARPSNEPSITTDGSVILMLNNNRDGHKYMLRLTEYS